MSGRWLLILAAFLLAGSFACAGEPPSTGGRFEVRQLANSSKRYAVYLPPGYSREKRWPVILFLHGAGERGSDPLAPTYAGLGPILRHSPQLYPCVAVFPQCETWDDRIFTSWAAGSEAGEAAMRALAEVEAVESIDPQHRVLTGWSMGGLGTTAWAAQTPERWSTVLAVSGGIEGEIPTSLGRRPLWLIHGDQDAIVSVDRSRQLAKSLDPSATWARYDEVAGAGHEVWERVYSNPRVAKWLLEGGDPPAIDWSAAPDPLSLPTAEDVAPFVPAGTVSHALAMRIGNDALRMLSAGIPESVRPERLQGTLDDIRQSLTVDGETYHLSLTGLTYAARLESTQLTCHSTGEIAAHLGVGLELRIQQAALTTGGFSARTGAFRIVIGHRRPVPLEVRVAPAVEAEKLRLTHRDTRFPIPDDDWYVEMPREIQIEGTKFTRHEIETGIVGGLYTRKADVEEQVRSVIPPLLKKVEQRLNLDTSGELTRWLWPFPVYQPRLRWKAETISVDARGMTVRLGAIIASNTPTAQRPPRSREGAATLSAARAVSQDLHLVVDPSLIEAVSEEFTVSGVARINVEDLPEAKFRTLADPHRLRAALTTLPPAAELRSVLAMTGPFEYRGPGDQSSEFQLVIPSAGLEVFQRTAGERSWRLAGRIPIAVEQAIRMNLESAPVGPPRFGIVWSKSPRIEMTPIEGVDPQGLHTLEDDLRAAWLAWTESRDRPLSPAQDFVLGHSRMRLRALELQPRALAVDLRAPATELRVTGSTSLRYRVRPHGGVWGLPQTLAAGQAAILSLDDIAQWQEIGQWGEVQTLAPGDVIEWNAETGVTVLSPAPAAKPEASPPVSVR